MTPLPLEPLLRLPMLLALTPSHGGDKLAYYSDATGRFELYVYDLATKSETQLTDGSAPRTPRSGLVWARDARALYYADDHGGDEKTDLWELHMGGLPKRLSDDPSVQDTPVDASPDGKTLLVSSTRGGQRNLFAFDLETRSWRQLTRFASPVYGGRWSPDGAWLACDGNESANFSNQDGYVLRADGSGTRRVLHVAEGSRDTVHAWHPDGSRLAVSSDASGVSRSGILSLDDGQVRWLGESEADETPLDFSPDGRWLLAVRNADAERSLVLYDLSADGVPGAARNLDLPSGVAWDAGFVLGGRAIVLKHANAQSPGDVLICDLDADRSETLIAAELGEIPRERLTSSEAVRYPSSDGQLVPALLYRPQSVPRGEKLPALIQVHGGPTWQFFRDFDPFAQHLVSRGCVVLQPNVRGSTGYGVAWRDAALYDWGGGDLGDVAAGAHFLAALPYVDSDRIGVMGASYGGFMSYLALVRQPELFRVGVPIVGITDLQRLYEENQDDLKYYLRQQMGDPEENQALWRERSAITHADNLRAKLLMLHGVNDPRCPVSQARGFRARLLELGYVEGQDFEYHEFADEGHGSADIAAALRQYGLVSDFLARWLF